MNTLLILSFALLFGYALCDGNTLQIHIFEGSTKWWLAVDPIDDASETTGVEVREYLSLQWVPAVLDSNRGYFQLASSSTAGFNMPLSFRFTSADGNKLVASDAMSTIVPGATVDMLSQYSSRSAVASTPAPTRPPTQAATMRPTTAPTAAPTQVPVSLCTVTSPLVEPVQMMVPLYVYPGAAWDQLISVAATGVKIVAVINPNNGPLPTGPDGPYTTYMKKFQDANIDMVGYVHTSWGARNINTTINDVNIWSTLYTGIKGIFFDEGAVDASVIPYYGTLYNAVKAKGWSYVILNPGAQPDQGYMAVSTNIVIYENYATSLMNTNFSSWVGCAPNAAAKAGYKYKFVSIVHTAQLSDMPWLIAESHRKGMGMIYVTDGVGGCCTYNQLCSYFPQEGTSMKSFNSGGFS